jgi:hypothetical protein
MQQIGPGGPLQIVNAGQGQGVDRDCTEPVTLRADRNGDVNGIGSWAFSPLPGLPGRTRRAQGATCKLPNCTTAR